MSEDWQIVPLSESSKDFSSKNKKKLFTFESLAILARVDSNHSGQYECHPDKLEAVSVNLHVVKGEKKQFDGEKYKKKNNTLSFTKVSFLFVVVFGIFDLSPSQ